jgi:hypothetical protein
MHSHFLPLEIRLPGLSKTRNRCGIKRQAATDWLSSRLSFAGDLWPKYLRILVAEVGSPLPTEGDKSGGFNAETG